MKNEISDLMFTEEIREKLKSKQLYLLCEFLNICRNNNLQSFLVGGSALGAVRHKGCIPWDDDIDVALPRPDYNKFIEIAPSQLASDIFLQTFLTDKDYRNDFAKLRLEGTTFIESSCRKLNINHGIYIDVFPIDGYPNKKIDIKMINFIKKVVKTYVGKDYVINNNYPIIKKILHKCRLIVCLFLCGFQRTSSVLKRLDKFYQRWDYNSCDEVVCHGGAWGELEHCPKVQYGNGTLAQFEGIDVLIPELYDEYLEHKYPNYMQLPAPDKRVPHHYCDVIDVDNSYRKYVGEK